MFSQRVANLWKSLPQRVVEAGSLEVFKVEVDEYLIDRGIEGDGEMA